MVPPCERFVQFFQFRQLPGDICAEAAPLPPQCLHQPNWRCLPHRVALFNNSCRVDTCPGVTPSQSLLSNTCHYVKSGASSESGYPPPESARPQTCMKSVFFIKADQRSAAFHRKNNSFLPFDGLHQFQHPKRASRFSLNSCYNYNRLCIAYSKTLTPYSLFVHGLVEKNAILTHRNSS